MAKKFGKIQRNFKGIRMKVILVTGGAGFIGSNFIRHILSKYKDYKIINYDLLTYAGSLGNLDDVKDNPNYTFVKGDVRDFEVVDKQMQKVDYIVHFAAESHVDRSIYGSEEFVRTNVLGTQVLLEAAKKNNVKRFVHISTDEVYGSLEKDDAPFTEETPLAPNNPYSASKAASDLLVRAYYKTFGFPAIITRCSNNYGPYQFPEKLIPLMIINAMSNKKLPIYGKGDNIRDWLYVENHCDAIYEVLNKGNIGETYNIGGNCEMKNLEVVENICDILDEIRPKKNSNSYKEQITFVKDRPGHDFRYAMDITKINQEFNWKPKESFSSGIRKTIEWYLENEKWWRDIQNKKYKQERLGVIK